MRLEYEAAGLAEADVADDPFRQFDVWLTDAVEAEIHEPNAVVVSTVDGNGQPWSRYVLLKAVDGRGFDFFTNYESNKSSQLADHPSGAMTFGWLELHRQVNIAGPVERLAGEESDRYWAQRTRGSQLGGWASAQSSVLESRDQLMARYDEIGKRFPNEVPRPPHWGGWRLVPHTVEFWQGRQNRLHDRLRYVRSGAHDHGWELLRLSP